MPDQHAATQTQQFCELQTCMQTALRAKAEFSDNLGPAEKAQRSLNRDAGVGREESVSNTRQR